MLLAAEAAGTTQSNSHQKRDTPASVAAASAAALPCHYLCPALALTPSAGLNCVRASARKRCRNSRGRLLRRHNGRAEIFAPCAEIGE